MKTISLCFWVFLLQLSFATAAENDSLLILAPYAGRLSTSYSNAASHIDLNESGAMTGAYAQWVTPKYFQANAFLYYSPSAGISNVVGLHLNADYYPYEFSVGKLVTGVDMEGIKIHSQGALTGLESFEMNNTVGTFMPRVGFSTLVSVGEAVKITAFPYAGLTYETLSGEVSVDPMGPPTKRTSDISSNSTYSSLGLNLTFNLSHFLELQGKYLAGLKSGGRLDSYGVLMNVYLSRNLAVSYRFKQMEFPNRSNAYHLLGLAVLL